MFSKSNPRSEGGIAPPAPLADPVDRTPAPARVSAGNAGSLISGELKIVGNLNSGGDLRIDGTVEGDITSRTLVVGETARIEGSITAESVRISGTVSGHVKATSVAIARAARVSGDITYGTLAVEEGGVLEGQCRRAEADNVAKLRPATATKPADQAAGR